MVEVTDELRTLWAKPEPEPPVDPHYRTAPPLSILAWAPPAPSGRWLSLGLLWSGRIEPRRPQPLATPRRRGRPQASRETLCSYCQTKRGERRWSAQLMAHADCVRSARRRFVAANVAGQTVRSLDEARRRPRMGSVMTAPPAEFQVARGVRLLVDDPTDRERAVARVLEAAQDEEPEATVVPIRQAFGF